VKESTTTSKQTKKAKSTSDFLQRGTSAGLVLFMRVSAYEKGFSCSNNLPKNLTRQNEKK
jgi:hypothetical protein